MKKISVLLVSLILAACSTNKMLNGQSYTSNYTTKGVFCYQLAPQDIQPGKNCIGSGGHN